MCKSCKKGRGRIGSAFRKNVAFSYADLGFGLGGAVSGLGFNMFMDAIGENMNLNEEQMATVNKITQAGKVIGGGALAMAPKVDRRAKMFGIGLAAEGAVEGAIALSEGKLGIAGASQYEDFVGTGALIDLNDYDEDVVASAYNSDEFDDE